MRFIEAFKMALVAIMMNKLRSILTLVGIIAGVASIVAVMTGISVIQSAMEKELSVLGTTTFQVQKWASGGPISEEERRKIADRRPLSVEHADAIRELVESVDLVGAELWGYQRVLQYRNIKTEPNIQMCGGTPEYSPNNTHYIEFGRTISHEDVKVGRSVVVLGHRVARELFPWTDPINKKIKIDGRRFKVIGVFEEKKSAMGGNFDNYTLIPITLFKRIYGRYREDGRRHSVNITVNAKSTELLEDAIAKTRLVMRIERGLKPNEEDDFTIYTNQSNIDTFNDVTGGVKIGAFIIGIVALIVAGIGIMNIMLVSITERTKEIGLRKALGAKRKNILTQFLLEAIILTNIGGFFGVLVGFGLGNIVSLVTPFNAHVPLQWILGGLIFCTSVGIVFGLWPAMIASKLDPIESLRFE